MPPVIKMGNAQGYVALVTFAAITGITILVLVLLRGLQTPPTPGGGGGTCAKENLCPAHGGADTQCCLGTEKCYRDDFLCCPPANYIPPQGDKPASCCPADQLKKSGGCCALGTVAVGDVCQALCPDKDTLCESGEECLQILYSTDSQKTQILGDLAKFKPQVDTSNKCVYACVPSVQGCEAEHKVDLMPPTINNTVLGYDRGNYAFSDSGDLCSNSHCLLQDLVVKGTPIDVVNNNFRGDNALASANVGQWCGKTGEVFMVRSVEGLKGCGWKRCFEELSYNNLQRVMFNEDTGACAGLFVPNQEGIAAGTPKDSNCEVLDAETTGCLDGGGLAFCSKCLQSSSGEYDCDASGSVFLENKAITKFYCTTGGCAECHFAGAQVGAMIECSATPSTAKKYDTLSACVTNEPTCQGTCKFNGTGWPYYAPWFGACDQVFLGCGCDTGRLAEVWQNNPGNQADLLGDGNHCFVGAEPWPGGRCVCSRPLFDDCSLQDADCTCRPKAPARTQDAANEHSRAKK